MRPSLAEAFLRCPRCQGGLALQEALTDPDGHVMAGTLVCSRCAASFPVSGGVPRLGGAAARADVAHTVDAFGYQWKQASTLFSTARAGSDEVFLDFVFPVTAETLRAHTVLDAGCGMGRFTLAAARLGAAVVVGVDLSEAVDAAFANTRHLANVLIVQGDVLHLPVAPAFDYAFSVGVLHHTSAPREAFLQVASKVRPGGAVSAWVYARENNGWIIHMLDPIRRVTSRLPRPLLLALAHVAAVPLTLVAKGVYRPMARWPQVHQRLFYADYLTFLAQFGYRELAFVTFDHAVPVIAEYIRRDDFAEWFGAAGLERVVITMRGGNSWRGFAVVPTRAPASP